VTLDDIRKIDRRYIFIYTYECVCMYVNSYIYINVCVCVCVYTLCVYLFMCVNSTTFIINLFVYSCVYVHVYVMYHTMGVGVRVCMHAWVLMICLPPQGTPPPHSSRYGPQHTQHTASTAATPHYPQGRRQTPADAPTPLKRSILTPSDPVVGPVNQFIRVCVRLYIYHRICGCLYVCV